MIEINNLRLMLSYEYAARGIFIKNIFLSLLIPQNLTAYFLYGIGFTSLFVHVLYHSVLYFLLVIL